MSSSFDYGSITRDAPFGTQHTPTVRTKLIGGKLVTLPNTTLNNGLNSHNAHELQSHNSQSPPQAATNGFFSELDHKANVDICSAHAANTFNVSPVQRKRKEPECVTSAQKDMFNSQNHTNITKNNLNPHIVLPPITAERSNKQPITAEQTSKQPITGVLNSNRQINAEQSSQPVGLIDRLIDTYIPRGVYLPRMPINYAHNDQLLLKQLIHFELRDINLLCLKDVYLELTGFDNSLSGNVSFKDLSSVLIRHKVNLSSKTSRLAASVFIVPNQAGYINYERFLSFIAECAKDTSLRTFSEQDRSPSSNRNAPTVSSPSHQVNTASASTASTGFNPITHEPDKPNFQCTDCSVETKPSVYYNPITQDSDISPRHSKFPFADTENAKLLRLIEVQFSNSNENLNFEKIWSEFRQADRLLRGTLSAEQIYSLTQSCRIPLQQSLIDQILEKCFSSNGQYSWQEYLQFIEKVHPLRTGLPIPQSQKPAELAKKLPTPSDNWPKTQEDPATTLIQDPTTASQQDPVKDSHQNMTSNRRSEVLHHDTDSVEPYQQKQQIQGKQINLESMTGNTEKASESIEEREGLIDDLEKQLNDLETKYKNAKSQIQKQEEIRRQESTPWFDRFMKLADALYKNDSENKGYLQIEEVKWLISQYNTTYALNLSEFTIKDAIKKSKEGKLIAIDPLLKILGLKN